MEKVILRKLYKEKRKTLTLDKLEDLSIDIANQLVQLKIWDRTYFHLFLPIKEQLEINTEYILHVLHAKDKEVVISKSDFETLEMVNYLLTDNTIIKKNSYNIPEPVDGIEVPIEKIDIVFIPLLAFDILGNRVGYGKGFYDRLLTQCNSNCIKIGLSFFEAEAKITDVFDTDIPLDYCVTPERIYEF
ncbi:MAG: 5-formyltetrahydrofolate cyclo-ligase [Flavobacteriaceae bacterium]|nr:5-formyltetrahydrofolate cyclo-ligase [Flavobacteriaceae bacterium]